MWDNFVTCLNAVLPIFLLMALGYLAKCLKLVDRKDVARINKVIFKLFFPIMMFYSVYNSDLSSAVRPALILYTVLGVLAAFALSIVFVHFYVEERSIKGVMVQGIYRSNFVIIGLPIATSLLGDTNLGPVAILMAVIVPLFNILAVIILQYYSGEKTSFGKLMHDILVNPLILGSAAGLIALVLGLKLPAALESFARQVNQSASPFLLFLLGAFFEFDGLSARRRELIAACVGRLIVVPGIFLTIGALLGFRGIEFAALIGAFASANAVTSFSMAQQMGSDAELAGSIVVVSSAACSFTMFLWCFLFRCLGVI